MPTISFRTCGVIVAMLLASAVVLAQGAPPPAPPATTPPPAGAPPGAGVPAPAQPAGEPYTYNPENRRDPFVSLLARGGVTESSPGKKANALSGLTAAEIMVKGVLASRGSYIALVAGPDGKTYTAHVGDRLLDGTIRSITPQGIVIMQEVNDPLSLVKQREVRKGLRALEDGK